jgi:hypothetical protein
MALSLIPSLVFVYSRWISHTFSSSKLINDTQYPISSFLGTLANTNAGCAGTYLAITVLEPVYYPIFLMAVLILYADK